MYEDEAFREGEDYYYREAKESEYAAQRGGTEDQESYSPASGYAGSSNRGPVGDGNGDGWDEEGVRCALNLSKAESYEWMLRATSGC